MQLEYEDGKQYHEGFRISASGLSRFFSNTNQWYREHCLGETGFVTSTAATLGTVVHACLEAYSNGEEVDHSELKNYVLKQSRLIDDFDVDEILSQYEDMAEVVIDQYLAENPATTTEVFIHTEILPGIHAGGSVDNRTGDIVVDYKTYNSSTPPSKIPYNYKLQLLEYAYVYSKVGTPITKGRVVYVNRAVDTRRISEKTGKPIGKYTSPGVTVLDMDITSDDLLFIESLLLLVAHSVDKFVRNPLDRFIIAQDYRLKDDRTDLINLLGPQPEEEEI